MQTVKRAAQLRMWVGVAPEEEAQIYQSVVMWGVWLSPDSEDCPPPDAMFSTEEEARAYVEWKNPPECDVSPCVVAIVARNNFDIPAAEPE